MTSLMQLKVSCYAYVWDLHLFTLVLLEDQRVLSKLRLAPDHWLHTTAKTIPHSLAVTKE